MNERIKLIRESNQLNQEEFGQRLRITKASVSRLESGVNNPSDQTVKLICTEFGINENWLRTGSDDMYFDSNNRYSMNLNKLQHTDNETIIRWVNTIAETNPEALIEIERFMKRLLGIE